MPKPDVLLTPDRRIGPGENNEIDSSLRRRSSSNHGVLWNRKRFRRATQPAGPYRPSSGKLLHSATVPALRSAAIAKINLLHCCNAGIQSGLSPSSNSILRGTAL
jgi:hypothetical protein